MSRSYILLALLVVGLVGFCSAESEIEAEESVAPEEHVAPVESHKPLSGFASKLLGANKNHGAGNAGPGFMSKVNQYGLHAKSMAKQAYDTSVPKVKSGLEAAKPHLDMALQKSKHAYETTKPKIIGATKPHLDAAAEMTRPHLAKGSKALAGFFGRMGDKLSGSQRGHHASEPVEEGVEEMKL